MVKNRCCVFSIVVLLVFSSIVVIDGVNAKETLDDGEEIEIEPNPYLDIYTNSPDAPPTNFEVPDYELPDDPPPPRYEHTAYSGESEKETWGEINSWLSLSVTPYKISGCDVQQDVFFAVHGVGFSETEVDTSGNDVDHWRPGEIELEAQQSDVDATLFYQDVYNAGFNTRGDTGAGEEMSDWGHVIYNAAGCLPVIGDFQDYAELGASVYNAASNNEVEEYETQDKGPFASVGSVWDVFPEEEELIVEDEGYYFGFATELHWQLKNDDVDLSQSHDLEISSTLITEHFEAPDQAPPTTSTTEGPEASVEISIRNAGIESVESENEGTNTHLSTEKYVQLSDVVSVELNKKGTITDPDDGYGPNSLGDPEEIPKIDLQSTDRREVIYPQLLAVGEKNHT